MHYLLNLFHAHRGNFFIFNHRIHKAENILRLVCRRHYDDFNLAARLERQGFQTDAFVFFDLDNFFYGLHGSYLLKKYAFYKKDEIFELSFIIHSDVYFANIFKAVGLKKTGLNRKKSWGLWDSKILTDIPASSDVRCLFNAFGKPSSMRLRLNSKFRHFDPPRRATYLLRHQILLPNSREMIYFLQIIRTE